MAAKSVKLTTMAGVVDMPIVGLGTFQIRDKDVLRTCIEAALDSGYRHIDTAYGYSNESEIGDVLQELFKAGKIKRDEIFITTKLAPAFIKTATNVRRGVEKSIAALKLDYVDLFLIHWPVPHVLGEDEKGYPADKNGMNIIDYEEGFDLLTTWRALEQFVDEGKIRAIGVSSLNQKMVEHLQKSARIPVSCNQVEAHAYFPQTELIDWCQGQGIAVTAFAPLGSPGRPKVYGFNPELPIPLDDPVVIQIAAKYRKTPAQILLRQLVERKVIVIPKSASPARIKENIQIFDFALTKEDAAALEKLGQKNQRLFDHAHQGKDHYMYPF